MDSRALLLVSASQGVGIYPGAFYPGTATIAPFAARFGQESADLLADSPGRGLTVPTTALVVPKPTIAWSCLIRFRSAPPSTYSTTFETIASKGGAVGSGSSDCYVGLTKRAHATGSGPWRLETQFRNGSTTVPLVNNASPAKSTAGILENGDHCYLVFQDSSGIPHEAFGTVGQNNDFHTKGDSVAVANGFFFPAASTGATITRTANEAVLNSGSSITAVVGDIFLISSSDSSFSGIQTVTRKPSGTSIAFASVGADTGAIASPTYAKQRTLSNLINTLGRAETAFAGDARGFAGAIGRVEMWTGAFPTLDGSGNLDPATFTAIKNGTSSLPGTKQYGNNCDPATGYAADADGTVTGPLVAIGTPETASSIRASWLIFDPWQTGMAHATVLYTDAGDFELGFTADAPPTAVYARVLASDGSVIRVGANCLVGGSVVGNTGTLRVTSLPGGCDYTLEAWIDGTKVTRLKFDVGPVYGIVSQSTYNVLFNPVSTGATLAPTNDATGRAAILDTTGGLGDSGVNPSNTSTYHRASGTPLRAANQFGNGIVGFTNKMIELRNAHYGRKVSVGVVNLCRSGHSPEHYYLDRQTFTTGIGTAVASVALTGNWKPVASTLITTVLPIYVEKGTVNLYVDGVLRATADTSGNWVGTNVTGTFNHDTGAYSVTLTGTVGVCTIEGRMQYDTDAGSSSPRRTADGFTVFGDGTFGTGHIGNILLKSPRRTADIVSWLNYFLSEASGIYSTALQTKFNYGHDQMLARIAPLNRRATPILVVADPRTESGNESGEWNGHRCQKVWADARGYPFGIGALSAAMDGVGSPHSSSESFGGQLIGVTLAHAIAKMEGLAGAKADHIYITAATPAPDRSYVDLTFNVPVGKSLVAGNGGEPIGIYGGTAADTLAELDIATHTVAITAYNTVRITKDSGTFANPYYFDYAAGSPIRANATRTTKALIDADCANMLFLNDGGYDGIRPGTPVQPRYDVPVSA